MRLWWWLLLDTESAFPIKQKLFSELTKKTQHLFLAMVVPIKWIIKYSEENENNCLRAWKIKQRQLTAMKTWICREDITFSYQYNTNIFQYFPVLISDHLASILQLYSLAYSKTCQRSKTESSARRVMRTISIPVENLYIFDDFTGRGECKG